MNDGPDEDKYKPGTKVVSCDVKGVVCKDSTAYCDVDEVIIKWETQQVYTYTRDWLDCNVKVIK